MKEFESPTVVTRAEWEKAREELLVQEKEHTRAADAIAASRRRLPMTKMEPVTVVGSKGLVPLENVFEGRSMLVIYHFMWKNGASHEKQCEGCTHSQAGITAEVCAYLAARDVTYAVFSMGRYEEISAYRDFMGWKTPWYSTSESGKDLSTRDGGDLRIYLRNDQGVFQTYETKWRGIEAMMPTLQLLDMTPFGRQESWEAAPVTINRDKAGSWWRKNGRPVAQWTRTDEQVS